MNVARHVLLSVVFLLVLIAPTSRAHAAEKLTVGAACTGDQNAADWDAIFQCVGSVWKRAPIWLGASADACDATHKGLIQWTGTGFQACSNGTSWESLGGSSSFLGANATNTAPSRSGDLGTGLFSDTASTVSVATAGVERLRLSATGATLTGDLNLSAVTNILSIAGTAILRHPVGNGTSLGIGRGSLQTQTGTVSYNYALGFQALRTNTASGTDAGSYNNAIGRRVLYSNTATGSNTGSYNNAIGNGALDTNIANGGEAGSYNNAIGSYTLNYNDAKGPSAGSLNNAIGLYALYNSIASGTFAGSNNNAFGMESL